MLQRIIPWIRPNEDFYKYYDREFQKREIQIEQIYSAHDALEQLKINNVP